jgi:DNA-binding response OmpR family regulator
MNIGLRERRRTILLVDSDPHARAGLRNALEAAGFSVGEAVNGLEGERAAVRAAPDAILAELLIGALDHEIADRLKQIGSRIPVYIVSTAADALVGAVGLHELGVAGVFLKPVDPVIVVQTLKTRLGAG